MKITASVLTIALVNILFSGLVPAVAAKSVSAPALAPTPGP